ncbi:MAG: IclR family transcriptional regulator [Trueperaceae bacterium]|nr:IclR family transcriptional regulator [Trueperaceae bacterium]
MSRTLDKGLNLLTLVAEGFDTLGDLARASGLPKSTVHRLTQVLVHHHLLRYQGHRFRLDYRLLQLSELARQQLDYLTVARPHLEEVSRRTSETVHLGVLADGHITYLEKIEGSRGLQMRSHVGLRVPAQTTALGKTLIASLPLEEWPSHLLDLAPKTDSSITWPDAMRDELATIRRQGYALDLEENEPGIRCIAVPVWDASGRAIAAISISGATVYLTDARIRELVPIARACAQTISRELGADDTPGGETRHAPSSGVREEEDAR